jgi:hypothetical protein
MHSRIIQDPHVRVLRIGLIQDGFQDELVDGLDLSERIEILLVRPLFREATTNIYLSQNESLPKRVQ